MSLFIFRDPDGNDIAPSEWLSVWADAYPRAKYDVEHDRLMATSESLTSAEFERIGRWKDAANTAAKWRPNVASVAYVIWMQAASASPPSPEDSGVAEFLRDWSERKYIDSVAGRTLNKRFGLSRATTLLYFLSRGRFPIFDSRVRRAVVRLGKTSIPNTVDRYLDSYRPLFAEIAARCGSNDLRNVDRALFSYGRKTVPFKPSNSAYAARPAQR